MCPAVPEILNYRILQISYWAIGVLYYECSILYKISYQFLQFFTGFCTTIN